MNNKYPSRHYLCGLNGVSALRMRMEPVMISSMVSSRVLLKIVLSWSVNSSCLYLGPDPLLSTSNNGMGATESREMLVSLDVDRNRVSALDSCPTSSILNAYRCLMAMAIVSGWRSRSQEPVAGQLPAGIDSPSTSEQTEAERPTASYPTTNRPNLPLSSSRFARSLASLPKTPMRIHTPSGREIHPYRNH